MGMGRVERVQWGKLRLEDDTFIRQIKDNAAGDARMGHAAQRGFFEVAECVGIAEML
jgi:hypothetical protein